MTISDNILNLFKKKMHITYDIDDDNLRGLLERSLAVIIANCGNFDVETNKYGQHLVLEHARYSFNDDSEFFMSNFHDDLAAFSFMLKGEEINNE